MATPNRNWTSTINLTFTDDFDQVLQYQEALFTLKETLKSAGWTVTLSSTGSGGSYGASDLWTSPADITPGSIFTPEAWITLESPAGFAGGSTIWILLGADDTSATNPNQFEMRVSDAPYTGGGTGALPSTAGTTDTISTSGDDILPWSTTTPGRMLAAYTDQGDVLFGVKDAGVPSFDFFLILMGMTDGDGGGTGDRRFVLWSTSFGLEGSTLESTTYSVYLDAGGGGAGAGGLFSPLWQTGWTDGLDYSGSSLDDTVRAFQTSGNGRFVGELVDLYATPTNLPFGALDTTEEGQTLRRVNVGELFVFVPAADLPLQ